MPREADASSVTGLMPFSSPLPLSYVMVSLLHSPIMVAVDYLNGRLILPVVTTTVSKSKTRKKSVRTDMERAMLRTFFTYLFLRYVGFIGMFAVTSL